MGPSTAQVGATGSGGDPWHGASLGVPRAPDVIQANVGAPPTYPSDPARIGGRWALHDEKHVLSGKGLYDSKSPQLWLHSIEDYLAGRNAEMDPLLERVERRSDEILHEAHEGASWRRPADPIRAPVLIAPPRPAPAAPPARRPLF